MSNWIDRGPKDQRYSSKRWKAVRTIVLGAPGGAFCACCGHSGAGSADHDPPVELHTSDDQFYSLAGLKPMHGTRSKCAICAAASGYTIKGDCQSLKSSLPMATAQQRLKNRTGLEFGEVPSRYPPRPAPAPEIASPPRTDPLTTTDTEWPYPTVQDAADDLMPLVDGSADYNLVADMLGGYAPCRADCDCGGGDGPGFCWCAFWDLNNVWTISAA